MHAEKEQYTHGAHTQHTKYASDGPDQSGAHTNGHTQTSKVLSAAQPSPREVPKSGGKRARRRLGSTTTTNLVKIHVKPLSKIALTRENSRYDRVKSSDEKQKPRIQRSVPRVGEASPITRRDRPSGPRS